MVTSSRTSCFVDASTLRMKLYEPFCPASRCKMWWMQGVFERKRSFWRPRCGIKVSTPSWISPLGTTITATTVSQSGASPLTVQLQTGILFHITGSIILNATNRYVRQLHRQICSLMSCHVMPPTGIFCNVRGSMFVTSTERYVLYRHRQVYSLTTPTGMFCNVTGRYFCQLNRQVCFVTLQAGFCFCF